MAVRRSMKISFPRYAEYNCALRYLTEHGFHNVKYIMPPALTKRTEEIGARYSPDFVCTPFKTMLGSSIEALETGADTLVMTHGYCRLGYYGELMEQILRDQGYHFDFINLSEYSTGKKRDWLKLLKRIDPKVNLAKFIMAFRETARMVEYLDDVTGEYYRNCGFDPTHTEYKRAYKKFLSAMYTVNSKAGIEKDYREAKQEFQKIPLDKPARPLKVGIVGEFFTAMDAFSNLNLEQKLADMRVEVHRWMNMTNHLFHYGNVKNLAPKIKELSNYSMGPTSTANIWYAKVCAEHRFDGIVHVKSANCTPEIDIMPVLQTISADYKIPTLYLTYDSQTSDVGLMTRLEAFYDMIETRKRALS